VFWPLLCHWSRLLNAMTCFPARALSLMTQTRKRDTRASAQVTAPTAAVSCPLAPPIEADHVPNFLCLCHRDFHCCSFTLPPLLAYFPYFEKLEAGLCYHPVVWYVSCPVRILMPALIFMKLNSPTSGGRSVGIVRFRTKGHG
jgi:hypothetical protein